MTAENWFFALVSAAVAGLFLVRLLLKPILAFTTTPKDDLSRIRANLEGVLGEAGPSMTVEDIRRTGGTLPTRSRQAERSYLVTLRRPDGSTEERTVRIEVALLGQGGLSVDPRPRSPFSFATSSRPQPDRTEARRPRDWRTRVPLAVRLMAVVLIAALAMVGLKVVSALPDIAEAKEQLSYVLHRKDIRIVQLYSGGSLCGLYRTARSSVTGWFYFDGRDVWTGRLEPGGARQDRPYGSTDPYDRWSRCVTNESGRRGDASFALWILGGLR